MRKSVFYVAAWFAAGAFAVTLASVGVSMVSDRVTDNSRPAPLSAAEVRSELDGATDEAATDTTIGTVPETTTTAVAAGATGSTDDGSSSGPTAPPPTGSSGSGGSGGSGGSDGPTTTTTVAPPVTSAPVTRTYPLVGGTVTLRFSTSGVTVLAATPKAGYTVKISDVHDGGARVEFEGAAHKSRVDGWWAGGAQDEVRED